MTAKEEVEKMIAHHEAMIKDIYVGKRTSRWMPENHVTAIEVLTQVLTYLNTE